MKLLSIKIKVSTTTRVNMTQFFKQNLNLKFKNWSISIYLRKMTKYSDFSSATSDISDKNLQKAKYFHLKNEVIENVHLWENSNILQWLLQNLIILKINFLYFHLTYNENSISYLIERTKKDYCCKYFLQLQ